MTKRIEMVARGYKVLETEEFIPAEDLIPFGCLKDIREVKRGLKGLWKKGENLTNTPNEARVERFANLMEAPFMKALMFIMTI